MSSLAEILEFKFPGVAGIRTRENDLGGMKIFDWPGPGPIPNAQQIAAWTIQYEARPIPPEPLLAEEVFDMLANKGILLTADRPRPRR